MKKTKLLLFLVTVLLTALIWPAMVLGQGSTGTLQGRILDPSGAVIPQAQITVTRPPGKNTTRGVRWRWFLPGPGLAAGTYIINATTAGFAPFTSSLTLTPGQNKNAEHRHADPDGAAAGASPSGNAHRRHQSGSKRQRGGDSREKTSTRFSDDPDELENQLQALAGSGSWSERAARSILSGFTGGPNALPSLPSASIRANHTDWPLVYTVSAMDGSKFSPSLEQIKLHGQIEVTRKRLIL